MRGVTLVMQEHAESVAFQPALPMRGVTVLENDRFRVTIISTRTPHAGSDFKGAYVHAPSPISTRTPHAGSDSTPTPILFIWPISTRTPHAGSDVTLVMVGAVGVFQPALPMRGVTAILCANLLPRSTYSANRQTRYTQQARQASLCHTIWCEPHVCHMRASCSHHGPTMPRTLQLRTLASHLHAQSSSHICFQDCRIANYLSPDRSARRARS